MVTLSTGTRPPFPPRGHSLGRPRSGRRPRARPRAVPQPSRCSLLHVWPRSLLVSSQRSRPVLQVRQQLSTHTQKTAEPWDTQDRRAGTRLGVGADSSPPRGKTAALLPGAQVLFPSWGKATLSPARRLSTGTPSSSSLPLPALSLSPPASPRLRSLNHTSKPSCCHRSFVT